VEAQPILKIAAKMLYPTVCRVEESVPDIRHSIQPPKTEENETDTNNDPAPCHTLKCPNRSI